MTLVNQPSWRPTRKLVAMIISGAVLGAAQTLLNQYWPDHPFAPYMENIDLWLQGAVMIIVGYMTRNKADELVDEAVSVQELDNGGGSQLSFDPLWVDPKEKGKVGVGEQTPQAKGTKS